MYSKLLPKVDSDFWKVWNCLYDPNDIERTKEFENPSYLANAHRAARYFVDEYLRPEKKTERPKLRELLRRIHLVYTEDLSSSPRGYSPNERQPDKFRDELPLTERLVRLHTHWKGQDDPISKAYYEATRQMDFDNPKPVELHVTFVDRFLEGEVSSRWNYAVNPVNPDSYSVKLSPAKYEWEQTVKVSKEKGLTNTVLPIEGIAPVLEDADEIMHRVLDLDPGDEDLSETNQKELFDLLARYYQMLTIGHLFKRTNHSMIVNQINCVLFLYAGKFLPHTLGLEGKLPALPVRTFSQYFAFILDNLPAVPRPVL